jgi:hypothetical protein
VQKSRTNRGPIEAKLNDFLNGEEVSRFPWLTSRGPIEASGGSLGATLILGFPWLTSRGPIEAADTGTMLANRGRYFRG